MEAGYRNGNSASIPEEVADGSVPGLTVRLFPGGGANWALIVRVKGEGGVNRHGKPLLGKPRTRK